MSFFLPKWVDVGLVGVGFGAVRWEDGGGLGWVDCILGVGGRMDGQMYR
jgi:hypothetical protein